MLFEKVAESFIKIQGKKMTLKVWYFNRKKFENSANIQENFPVEELMQLLFEIPFSI